MKPARSWDSLVGMNRVAPADPQAVNLREREEVAWRCGELGCSANELRRAVSAVGVSPERVQEFIERFTA
jgi:hypothetical protein